jgi:SAM-dependent methyltransferase
MQQSGISYRFRSKDLTLPRYSGLSNTSGLYIEMGLCGGKFMPFSDKQDKSQLARLARHVGKDWATSGYYDLAEQIDWLEVFWSAQSPFWRFFQELDLTCVLELACGHGRHSEKVLERSQNVILMDINIENIEFCQQRFRNVRQSRFILTDGYAFDSVKDNECTAVFSYDAMVHFDSDVVRAYLEDTARILVPGGRALFHHSNYDLNPGGNVHDNPRWRNFMSKKLFNHYAMKSGLTCLASEVLDWESYPALDCVTLLER